MSEYIERDGRIVKANNKDFAHKKSTRHRRNIRGYKCTCERCKAGKLYKSVRRLDPDDSLRDMKKGDFH